MIVDDTAQFPVAGPPGMAPATAPGFPVAPPLDAQAAIIAAATCPPPCGLLSRNIVLVATSHALTPDGLAVTYAEFCVCDRGHWWPHVQTVYEEDP